MRQDTSVSLQTAPLDERAAAYERVAPALEWLGDSWSNWPDLGTVAAAAGLSRPHFQREFSRWAGLSTRQLQGATARAMAGETLTGGTSAPEARLETGLSRRWRLHDLFIADEAISPAEAKAKGRGSVLCIGRAPTPFGMGAWLTGPRGLIALGFIDADSLDRTGLEHQSEREEAAFADLAGRYAEADIRRDDRVAEKLAEAVFACGRPLPVCLYGTPFRRQVWRALLDSPPGTTLTYGALAAAIGAPGAARAVGAAVGANPISWFIPCHRALAAHGRLHNYHWGIARKRAMLVYESAHTAASAAV